MDLTQISNRELLNRVEKLSRTERKITHLILCHLVEVETRRLHLELGYTSLFRYMTAHLHYSEDAAYRRIQAARLLKKMPQLEKAIEVGEVNLTQLQQVQKCLNKEIEQGHKITIQQTEKVLEQIQNKSSFETQKILAIEFNQPIQQIENLKPQRDDSVRVEFTLNAEQMQKLQQAKDLLSHVLPNPTWAELIAYLATTQIEKRLGKLKAKTDFNCNEKDHEVETSKTKKEITSTQIENSAVGLLMNSTLDKKTTEENRTTSEKTARTDKEIIAVKRGMGNKNSTAYKKITKAVEITTNKETKKDNGTSTTKNTTPNKETSLHRNNSRPHIKITTRRALLEIAQHQCEYVHATTGRCPSKFLLQVDHKKPLAFGGSNEFSNLRVLCQQHNLSEARRWGISRL